MTVQDAIAVQLPYLRRFARALGGSQQSGDRLVRDTLQTFLADKEAQRAVSKSRTELYRIFIANLRNHDAVRGREDGVDTERMPSDSRIALLLTTVEEFSADAAATIMGVPTAEISQMVARAVAEIEAGNNTDVLIIEDDPLISMQLERVVEELGHNVVGVARTREQALLSAQSGAPDLILADIMLADGDTGLDAVAQIQQHSDATVIFVTAYPERLLTEERPEPTYLITKPFQEATVRAAISQALFFRGSSEGGVVTAVPDDAPAVENEVHGSSTKRGSAARTALRALEAADLESRPSPIDTAVAEGRLVLDAGKSPQSVTALANLEVLQGVHLDIVDQILERLESNSLPLSVERRLRAIRRNLSAPFTESSGTALGVQARGFRAVVQSARDTILDDVATDLLTLADDLFDLALKFPLFTDFIREAEQAQPMSPDEREQLIQVSRLIEDAPDSSVDPHLKVELASLREDAEELRDLPSDQALLRTIGNVVRSIGRFFQSRLKGVRDQATKTFDESMGKALGAFPAQLIQGGLLLGAAQAFPHELGVALVIAGVVKTLKK